MDEHLAGSMLLIGAGDLPPSPLKARLHIYTLSASRSMAYGRHFYAVTAVPFDMLMHVNAGIVPPPQRSWSVVQTGYLRRSS